MKISIITTCFNAEAYIEETIESVICQRGDFDLEYIIIDGNSTDKTNEIIRKYYEKWQRNELQIKCNNLDVKYLSEPDNGMYDGIAKGLEIITGEVMAYINADDFYMPNAFSAVLDIMSQNPEVSWIHGVGNICNKKGHNCPLFPPYYFVRDFIQKGFYGTIFNYLQQESMFWRTNLLKYADIEKFRQFKMAGDYYLWYEFSKKEHLFRTNIVLAAFRFHGENKSKDINQYLTEFNMIKDDSNWLDELKAKIYLLLCNINPRWYINKYNIHWSCVNRNKYVMVEDIYNTDLASSMLGLKKGYFISEALLKRIEGGFFKPMNRDIARENMSLFKKTMDKLNVEFFLFFGTLLGAVREGDFIAHDYDTDIVIMEKDRRGLLEAVPLLIAAGFEFARRKNHARFVTFLRNGEYIDVYVAEEAHRFLYRLCWNVDGVFVSHDLLTEFTDMVFIGENFRVPHRYEEALTEIYDADWRVEKKNCPSKISFDLFHPVRSGVPLLLGLLPSNVKKGLKRLMGRK